MRFTTALTVLVLGAAAMPDVPTTLPADLFPADAKVEKLATGMKFIEGPIWVGGEDGYLLFSDIAGDALKKWSAEKGLETFRTPSQNANGNTLDRDGRLITCEHGSRTVTRTDLATGKIETIAAKIEGKQLNSPNDVVVKSDGTIWFTDPPYGLGKREKEVTGNDVYRLDPKTGALTIVAKDFDHPNGLCFSPDESVLYIADSGKPHDIRKFAVQADGALTGGEVFATIDPGVADGMRCDSAGNLWSTAGDGVHVFSPEGKLLAKIAVPETPANLCFGGKDGTTLFMTARTSLYSIRTLAKSGISTTDKHR